MKRILAVILSLMMVFTTLGTVTFAAGGATNVSFTVDKTTAAVGDTITVTLSNGAMTVESFTCGFTFDLTKLECKSISGPNSSMPKVFYLTNNETNFPQTATAVSDVSTSNNQGTVGIAFAGTTDTTYKAGVLLTATFEVKATGDAAFTLYEDTGGTDRFKSDAIVTKTVSIAKAPISSVTASVEKPEAGKALDFNGTVDSSAPYSIAKVEWFEGTDDSGTSLTNPTTAKADQFYYARITLTANPGETFAASLDKTFSGDYSVTRNSDTELYLTKAYPITGSLPPASVTAVPTAKADLKYNGSEQELLGFVGNATNGTMQYSLDNATWSATTPTGKDAKTYTVYYKAVGDSTHSDSTVANIQVTIGQKDISGVTIGTIANQSYTGAAIEPSLVVKDGTKTLVKGTDYTVSCTNKYAGPATLTITGKGNYTGETTANFTIVAANQNPTFTTPVDLVKGGQLDLRTLVQGAKGEMTFTIAPGTTSATLSGYTLTSTGIKGEVKVSVSITAKDMNDDGKNEYNAFSKSEAITVNVVDKTSDTATMKVSQSDITYGESVSPSVTNKPDGTGTVRYTYEGRDGTTYSSSATAPTNVGKYKVKAKCESSTTIYTAEDDFEILPKSISGMTVTLNKTSLEYNGSAQTVNVTVKNGSTTLTKDTDYTVTGITSSTNVGSYTVTVAGKGNYTGSVEKTWKITPATLTVNGATVAAKIYDGSTDATVSAVTFSGTKGSDALTVGTDYTVSGVFNSANVNDANNVIVTVTLKDTTLTKNYKLASSTYNQAAAISQAPTPAAPTGLTGIKGNLLNTVALPTGWTWVNGTQKMEEAGVDKPFGAHYEDPNGNYAPNISGTPVLITVLAKTDVNTKITFPNGSLVYNGNGQKYEKASISGITASGTAEWTCTYAVDPSTATATLDSGLPLTVGKYTVTATYEDSANYGTATATLEITPAKPTVTPKFDKITEKGKTLANANLTIASSSPVGGKIEWVDDAGAVLPGTTTVEANKAYKWRYTPLDTTNYAPVYGTIVVYPTSTGIVVYCPHYTIKASAGANGTISPAGWCSVAENGSQTFTFTPDKGYTVAKVLVDGKSVGAVKSYTFKDVTKDHTIEVIFMKSNGNPATGAFVMP